MMPKDKADAKSSSDEIVVDANIYALLLEVINRHEDDSQKQQQSMNTVAEAMHTPTWSRRLFRVLFPSVESSRRVR